MMNGDLVHERTKEDLVINASTRIAGLVRDASTAIQSAYLAVLTRRPSEKEENYFLDKFSAPEAPSRVSLVQALVWALLNSAESSWNH